MNRTHTQTEAERNITGFFEGVKERIQKEADIDIAVAEFVKDIMLKDMGNLADAFDPKKEVETQKLHAFLYQKVCQMLLDLNQYFTLPFGMRVVRMLPEQQQPHIPSLVLGLETLAPIKTDEEYRTSIEHGETWVRAYRLIPTEKGVNLIEQFRQLRGLPTIDEQIEINSQAIMQNHINQP